MDHYSALKERESCRLQHGWTGGIMQVKQTRPYGITYIEILKKKRKLIETEGRKVTVKFRGWGKQGEVGKSVKTFSYKMTKI